MEKATVKRFSGVFLKLVNLTAVICILCLIPDIAHTKSDSPITLLSSTARTCAARTENAGTGVTDVKSTRFGEGLSRSGTGGSVLNESEKKAEPEAIKPENTTKKQNDNSESNTEPPRLLPKGILRIVKATAGGEWESIEMRVTAYCPCPKCCGEYSDGVTACGYKIRPGDTFVAADRRYPFRTEMLIPGYSNSQPVKVLDRGGAIKGNRLDVFFATHEEALKWGVKYLEVNVRRKNL